MWSAVFCCLLVTGVTAVPAWIPGKRYEFRVRSRALTALHQVSNQYAGLLVKADLAVEPRTQEDLLAQLYNILYAEVNMEMPLGGDQEIPEINLTWDILPFNNSPFEVQLQNGLVKRLLVTNTTKQWEANFLKGILSSLQVNAQGEHLVRQLSSSLPEANSRNAFFKTMESSVTGECEVQYVISPLPEITILQHPELAPLREVRESVFNINKIQNFSNCNKRRAVHFGFIGIENFEPGNNKMGQFMARTSMSRVIISGTLNNFTIQSTVITNKVLVSPEMYNNQKGLIFSRVNVTLQNIRSQKIIVPPLNALDVGDLVYRYNDPFGNENIWHHKYKDKIDRNIGKSRQKDKNTLKMSRLVQQLDNFRNASSSDENYTHEFHENTNGNHSSLKENGHSSRNLHQTELTGNIANSTREGFIQIPVSSGESLNIPLLPFFAGNEGYSVIAPGGIDPVKTVYKLAIQIATDILDPQTFPEHNTLARFILLTRLIRTFNQNLLLESTRRLYTKEAASSAQQKRIFSIKVAAWKVFRDAVAEAGTGPALLTIRDWIQTEKIENESAAEVVGALSRTALAPSAEYLGAFFDLVKDNKTLEQSQLHEAAVLSFTRLLRLVAVDDEHSHQHYPTYVFGNMVPKDFPQLRQIYIPYFGNLLKDSARQRNSTKIALFIRALGEIAHPDILPYFEPYLEKQDDVTEYQRILTVILMRGVLRLYPEIVRPLVLKIYENTGESYRLRCPAAHLLLLSNPPVEVLQRMAELTNLDTDVQVISFVQSALRDAAQLKGPFTLKLARNAKAAVNLLNPVNLDATFSRAFLESRMVKDHDMGYMDYAGYTGSTDSPVPNAFFLKMVRIIGGSLNDHIKAGALLSSVRETLNLLGKKLKLDDGDHPTFNEMNVEDLLNIIPDREEQVEGNFLYKLMGTDRFFTFDNNTLDKIPEIAKHFIRKYKTLRSFNFTKLYDAAGITLAFPNALGLPALYTVNVPIIVTAGGRTQINTTKDFGIPTVFNITADINLTYSMRKMSHIGFFSPFNTKQYVAAVERSLLINIPLNTVVDVNIDKKKINMLLKPRDDVRKEKLLQWNTIPYTTKHNILNMQPLLEDSETKVIHVLPPKRINKMFGVNTTGVVFVLEGKSEQEFLDKQWLFQNLRPYDFLSRIQFFWASRAIQYNNITLSHDVRRSTARLVNINAVLDFQSLPPDEKPRENSGSEEYLKKERSHHFRNQAPDEDKDSIAYSYASRSSGSRKKRLEFLAKVHQASGLYTKIVDIAVEFVGHPTAEFTFAGGVGLSEVNSSAIVTMFVNLRPDVKYYKDKEYMAVLYAHLSMPQVPVVNFYEALNFEPNSTLEVKLEVGDDYGKWGLITIEGDFKQSDEIRRDITLNPITKLCWGQMKTKNNLLPACRRATEMANRLDKYHFKMTYSNVPDVWINATYNAYAMFRRCAAPYVKENILKTRQRHGVLEVDVSLKTSGNALSMFIETPLLDISLKDVRLNKWTRALLQLNPGQNLVDRLGKVAFPLYYQPTCILDHSFANTFDNNTYPLKLDPQWYVMMVRVPKIPADVDNAQDWRKLRQNGRRILEVLVRQPAADKRDVKVRLVRSSYQLQLKISKQQNFLVVEANEKPLTISKTNATDVILSEVFVARLYELPEGALYVYFPQDQLILIHDGERVMLQASNLYRDEVRGLCGTFDGDLTTDFTIPQNCIVKDSLAFVKSYVLPNASIESDRWMFDHNRQICVDLRRVPIDIVGKHMPRNPASRGFDLLHPVNDSSSCSSSSESSSSSAPSSESASNCGLDHISISSSSSESAKGVLEEPSRKTNLPNTSIIHRTMVVEEATEICFSMRPLPECSPHFTPVDRLKKKIRFHCMAKGGTANHWSNMVKKGVNPDFSRKREHKHLEVEIATKCTS